MAGYWNAHSDRDFEDQGEPDFDTQDEAEEACIKLREEIRDLESIKEMFRAQVERAVKWARDYEDKHGPFKPDPPIPDFMIAF